jgi:hypothetical protein
VAVTRTRILAFAAVAAAALALSGAPASAQGLFDFFHNGGAGTQRSGGFLGGLFGQQRRQYVPQQASPYADPNQAGSDRYGDRTGSAPSSGSGGGRVAYCVRLCDGRYFPIHRNANANPAQLCSAFCPAAKTQVFNGSQIDHAYASNGQRYADLDNAFVYRERVIDNCTCNGKDSFGLVRIDVASDPTLRAGDIIASGDNVKAALIAMHAAKERAREANSGPPALRGSSRTATVAPAPAAKTQTDAPVTTGTVTPSEATDDIPED